MAPPIDLWLKMSLWRIQRSTRFMIHLPVSLTALLLNPFFSTIQPTYSRAGLAARLLPEFSAAAFILTFTPNAANNAPLNPPRTDA